MPELTAAVEVLKPGAFSTLQDLGRRGFQHLGVSVSGVMDEIAHRLANAAVGNPPEVATLEITLIGPVLRFGSSAVIACFGADLSASLNGKALAPGRAASVPAGATLRFGARRAGLRAYLAVRGGFALERVLGSASTLVRAGLGGHAGRPLAAGDVLTLAAPLGPAPRRAARALRAQQALLDAAADPAPLRVVLGSEWPQFTPAAQAAWLGEAWRIGAQSDRMGYRLEGPVLERRVRADMLSETVTFGTVQVPPDGRPIVLMADRQSTGGYPRIAQVATADLPRLAQRAPGEMLRFETIDVEAAQRLLLERARLFADLAPAPRALRSHQTP
ncbi:MAG: biotin-dependent carboxyltransferase family protein [Betaproteobacteria bacterium]|nr:biotin-dependent carboxyltransferase family protein [Betaproteobacteria bacterium]